MILFTTCYTYGENLFKICTAQRTKFSVKVFFNNVDKSGIFCGFVHIYYILAECPGGDCSTHRGKCLIFKNFPGWDLGLNFPSGRQLNPSGMIWKSREVNRQIYCVDLKIYTWFTQKYRDRWVTFKRQKSFLKVENRTQYTNHQMNKAVKNQIYPKKSQCIPLEWLYDMMCDQDSHTHYRTS